LASEITSFGKEEYVWMVEGKIKDQVYDRVIKTNSFEAIYPDGDLELIKMLLKQDFPSCYDLKFRHAQLRTRLLS
jgi:hypothetical protein